MFQSLEQRKLLAAVGIENAVLRIVGTSGDDQIDFALVSNNQAQVYDAGVAGLTFDLDSVKAVSFAGLEGNDVLIMGRVPLRVWAVGGSGDDAISASRAAVNDSLFGDEGNDYLYGGDGDDTLVGGPGYDGLIGGRGNDYIKILSDASGDDTVGGGSSLAEVGDHDIDTVDATDYTSPMSQRIGDRTPAPLTVDDFIFEDIDIFLGSTFDDNVANVSGRPMQVSLGDGNDIYTGGSGNETVDGGSGTDSLFGAGGDDIFNARDNEIDQLNGGSGDDTVIADANDILIDIENA
jgi:Ca2+-binding RTX toxin-like protein